MTQHNLVFVLPDARTLAARMRSARSQLKMASNANADLVLVEEETREAAKVS